MRFLLKLNFHLLMNSQLFSSPFTLSINSSPKVKVNNQQIISLNPMKLIPFLALFVLICSTNANVAHLAEYEESLKAWNKLRPRTYTFVPYTEDYMYAFNITTAITVTDGQVVKRVYKALNYEHFENENESGTETDEFRIWTEDTRDTIGTHSEGFLAITLDDVYKQCRESILVNDNMSRPVVFKTDERGLLQECYFSRAASSHPYPIGIRITRIEL